MTQYFRPRVRTYVYDRSIEISDDTKNQRTIRIPNVEIQPLSISLFLFSFVLRNTRFTDVDVKTRERVAENISNRNKIKVRQEAGVL